MSKLSILGPVLALVTLTFAVGVRMAVLRVQAVKTRTMSISYFKTNQGEMPERIIRASQNYQNLLELPILFYLLVTLLLLSAQTSVIQLVLAWVFVALRVVHSVIHVSYNNVIHRSVVWMVSALVLVVMWLIFASQWFMG